MPESSSPHNRARRPRLVVVSDYAYPSGGIEQSVYEVLARAGASFDCRLLTWHVGAPIPAGIEEVHIDCGDVRRAWDAMSDADVLLIVTSFNVRMLARLAGDVMATGVTPGVVAVQTSAHSDAAARSRGVQDQWLLDLTAASTCVVAVSEAVGTALRELGVEAAAGASPVVVIENGARMLASPRERGRRRVAFIGRPAPQKGYDLFLRLADELADAVGELEFVANTVSVPVLDPPVGVPHCALLKTRELADFIETADVLVVPYRTADGLPLAVLEALNCGLPVIGLDSPAVRPLLERHGQVVVPDYAALRDAVQAWAQGHLDLTIPVCGSVSGWDDQYRRYADVLEHAVVATYV